MTLTRIWGSLGQITKHALIASMALPVIVSGRPERNHPLGDKLVCTSICHPVGDHPQSLMGDKLLYTSICHPHIRTQILTFRFVGFQGPGSIEKKSS